MGNVYSWVAKQTSAASLPNCPDSRLFEASQWISPKRGEKEPGASQNIGLNEKGSPFEKQGCKQSIAEFLTLSLALHITHSSFASKLRVKFDAKTQESLAREITRCLWSVPLTTMVSRMSQKLAVKNTFHSKLFRPQQQTAFSPLISPSATHGTPHTLSLQHSSISYLYPQHTRTTQKLYTAPSRDSSVSASYERTSRSSFSPSRCRPAQATQETRVPARPERHREDVLLSPALETAHQALSIHSRQTRSMSGNSSV